MKKKILLLLAGFSLIALAGGIYLAFSFERRLSDFNQIIMLHHVENMREHLLLDVQKVRMDLYSQNTLHPESRMAIDGHVSDMKKSIKNCYGCHHYPDVVERLIDLQEQIEQFEREIVSGLASSAGNKKSVQTFGEAHLIGDSLFAKVETMVVTTSEKLREQTEDSLRKAHGMKLIMISLIAAGPLIMIIFAITVMRGVTKPVQALLTATRKLKKGNLDHRISGLKDEFGELAVAFNDMAGSLLATMRAIEESEKRYRLLFEEAADAIFILEAEGDQIGMIVQANQAAVKMHGYTLEELRGMKIQDLDTAEDAAAAPARIERIMKGEWIKTEGAHRRKDESVFPVEIRAGLLETAGHRFIMAIDRDLTERREAEKEMQRMERVRISGELATGLAHEIKNPLAGIKVSMEALSEESYLSDEDRGVLNKVIGEIKRIEYLMKGLLNFAQPPKPQLLSTDINAVLDTVASLVLKEGRIGNNSHAIQVLSDLEHGMPEIMADPMQLQQIFMNLLLNAVDAMPDGGMLTMKTAYDRQAQNVQIELSDTGKGIDAETLAKIFNPFFTTKAKGTGLGLSITKRLVEEHGGKIRLHNNSEGGITCLITLPVRQS